MTNTSMETTTQTTPTAAPEESNAQQETLQKWTTGPGLGKIMCSRFNKALSACSWASKGRRGLKGIHGKPETEKLDNYATVQICGKKDDRNELHEPGLIAIQQKHGHEVGKANYKAIVDALTVLERKMDANPIIDDQRVTQEEHDAEEAKLAEFAKQRQQEQDEREAAEKQAAENWKTLEKKIPNWAKAAIVAQHEVSDCDLHTDYFASHTDETVLIGWRSGEREDFRQLRQAAAGFEHTAHLGPGCDDWTVYTYDEDPETNQYPRRTPLRGGEGDYYGTLHFRTETEAKAAGDAIMAQDEAKRTAEPFEPFCPEMSFGYYTAMEDVEHRDNYSMGAGNWLGMSRYSGWQVKSVPISSKLGGMKYAIPESGESAAEDTVDEPEGSADCRIAINQDKGGVELHFASKPDASTLEGLKAYRWRWSRFGKCWYKKDSEAARFEARKFAGVSEDETEEPNPEGACVQAQEDAYFDNQARAIGA